jgi:hypothetical protein
LGDWLYAPSGVSSFGISTVVNGRPASEMKAIMYGPGCAIQTLDLKPSDSATNRYAFVCNPIRNIEVSGVLSRSDRLWDHTVKLQARYIAHWATQFLGVDNTLPTSIVVGDMTSLSADGRFRLVVPDFSQGLSAEQWDSPGEFQIWAKDESTGVVVALLVPQRSMRSRMGGLKLKRDYPPEITFTPCAANSAPAHNKIGFAIRPGSSDACDPF